MMRSLQFLACLGLFCSGSAAFAQPEKAADNPEAQAARAVGQSFVKDFNLHNAPALGALWKADGVYTSVGSGEKLSGRAAIEANYVKLFEADPKCQVSVRLQTSAEKTGEGVSWGGILDETHTDGSVTSSHVDVNLVLVNGKWQIAEVHETDLPVSQPPGVQLQQLSWFLGSWEEKEPDGRVSTEVREAPGGNFLLRKYSQKVDGKTQREGMQTIGWDQQQQCFRTWMFDLDGSFGEGYWVRSGDNQWTVKMAIKLPDGRQGSLTQIINTVGTDKIEIQNVDQSINGAALPNSPVATLERVAQP